MTRHTIIKFLTTENKRKNPESSQKKSVDVNKIILKFVWKASVKAENIKTLEENIRKMLLDFDLDNDFFDTILKVQVTKAKINKCIKLKSFCT